MGSNRKGSDTVYGNAIARMRRTLAFTLIEMLVVVAIIAVLLAILFPSLSMARTQAKIASCKANLNQVATMMASYQTEYREVVPVVFNYYACSRYNVPARTALLSLALRGYDGRRAKLPPGFDLDAAWSDDKKAEYERTLLPAHFVCPFVRDGGTGEVAVGTKTMVGPSLPFPATYTLREHRGRYETCQTWLWEDVVRGEVPGPNPRAEKHPNDPREGRAKYSVLSWNKVAAHSSQTPDMPGALGVTDPKAQNAHRKWELADARRRNSSSLSEMTVIYCAQGNHMEFGREIWNPDGHKTGAGGGTNVVFADTHVEWVVGTQVGWP